MKFWVLWGFDAIASLVILYFFVAGLADGSVSSFNMGLWLGIVVVVCAVMVGSLALRSSGRSGTRRRGAPRPGPAGALVRAVLRGFADHEPAVELTGPACLSHASIWAWPTAPACWKTGAPDLKTMKFGMPRTA